MLAGQRYGTDGSRERKRRAVFYANRMQKDMEEL